VCVVARRNERTPTQAREILDYFLRNPQAADSLEGVARWRLLEGTIQRGVEEISQALGWLVAQGFLTEEPVTGSGPLFSLNHERTPEAERFATKGKGSGRRTRRKMGSAFHER